MLYQTNYQSKQHDSHVSERNHDDSPHYLLERGTSDTSRNDTLALRNYFDHQRIIPDREVSSSIEAETQRKRNIATAHDIQERLDLSLALTFLQRNMSSMFPMNINTGLSFNNLTEEGGTRSYDNYFTKPFVQYPIFQRLQSLPMYHDMPFRHDYLSPLSTLHNNCISVYTNGSEEKEKKSKQGKVPIKNCPKKARKKRKPKGQPKRPLSAYNIYFQDERRKILSEIPGTNLSIVHPERQRQPQHHTRPPKKMPHGKIGFENLAKEIGQRWQRLDGEQISYYKGLAVKEMILYKEAMRKFRGEDEVNSKTSTTPDAII
jgi:hypothetical protein